MKTISYNAPLTLSYCLLSLFILIIDAILVKNFGINFTKSYFMMYQGGWNDPEFYFRLFSHTLGHQDLSHFINNFLLILLVGPLLEEKYGSLYLLFLTLINSFVTGLIFIIIFPNEGLLGASGVLFMMIIMTSFTNKNKNTLPLTLIFVAGLYLGQDIYNMLFQNDNISQVTHLLGGVIGLFGVYCKKNGMKDSVVHIS